MDIFEQAIFAIGGAWTCLVGFLVLGMYRQNHYVQHKARANKKFLTATSMNRTPVDAPPAVASSSYPGVPATRPPAGTGAVNHRPKENGIKLA